MRHKSNTAEADKAAKKAAKAAEKEKVKGKRNWKLMGSAAALAGGFVTAKALEAVWRTATGHAPPNKPENPDLAAREAIAWAGLSGMAIGVAKVYGDPKGGALLGQVDRAAATGHVDR